MLFKDSTEAIISVDASNAFNSLNRQAALRNIRRIRPPLATILINTHKKPSELFVDRQKTLWSEEGTTQGDPLAIPMYALATVPLIDSLSQQQDTKQVWYADDASAAGSLTSLKCWWDNLTSSGPAFGYHANAIKTWLITKEQYLSKAKDLFRNNQINITSAGRPHLGAGLGSTDFINQHVNAKVTSWCEELQQLSMVANTQPQAAYTAFTHGFVHKFTYLTYLARTVPDIDHLLQPLEDTKLAQDSSQLLLAEQPHQTQNVSC